jgi:tetratricopeptide (TPR) repeat protein
LLTFFRYSKLENKNHDLLPFDSSVGLFVSSSNIGSRMAEDNSRRHFPAMRWGVLLRLAVSVTLVLVAAVVVPPWLAVFIPNWLVQNASIALLWTLLVVYAVVAPAIVVSGGCAVLAAVISHYRRERRALESAMRLALVGSICLLGLIVTELVSRQLIRGWQRLAVLPTEFEQQPSPRAFQSGPARAEPKAGDEASGQHANPSNTDDLYLVVIGESSAGGEPYRPWLSVGQIVGWQLERVFPGRKIDVDVRAEGGLCFEQAVLLLTDLKRRPDAIIVFSGQNEFITRFHWERNVSHYLDEGPESPSVLLERARSSSSTLKLIVDTLDRLRVSAPPPPRITRELIDHPSFGPHEFAFLLDDFHRRLDALTAYCNQIGALPILIVPGSNDGAYEPSRSVLAPSTPVSERAEFAREFQTVRAAESDDVTRAIARYRRLVERHPEFAESHYRLARLLVKTGDWEEAERHFVFARELDSLVLRCPNDFRAAIRTVAQHHHALLIDGPAVLASRSPHGIVDDHLFHDAQHANLEGYVALAQETLEQFARRQSFGWPESMPVPRIDLKECADHYALDAAKWSQICERSSYFYGVTAYVRFDPSERLEVARRYEEAAQELAAGRPLPRRGLKSLDMPIPIPGGSSPSVVESAGAPSN